MKFCIFVLLISTGKLGTYGIPVQLDRTVEGPVTLCELIQIIEEKVNGKKNNKVHVKLVKTIVEIRESTLVQITRKDNPDQGKDAELLKKIEIAIADLEKELQQKCSSAFGENKNNSKDKPGENNSKEDIKENSDICDILRQVAELFQDKQKRQGKVDVVKDEKLCELIRIIDEKVNGKKNNKELVKLVKHLVEIRENTLVQIAWKDNPDQAKDAELLKKIEIAIADLEKEVQQKCSSASGENKNNSKDKSGENDSKEDIKENSDICDILRQVAELLQDKHKRQGKVDVVKDEKLCELIQIIDEKVNGKKNNKELVMLVKHLVEIREDTLVKIARKDNPDQAKDTEVLKKIEIAIADLQKVLKQKCSSASGENKNNSKDKSGENNSKEDIKENSDICDILRQVAELLQDKHKRQGKVDVVKDEKLCELIQIIDEKVNGKKNNKELVKLVKHLVEIREDTLVQIARKDNPDQAKDTELLKKIEIAIADLEKELQQKCSSASGENKNNSKDKPGENNSKEDIKENSDICDILRQVAELLQDKHKRQGKVDVVKDEKLCELIQIIDEKVNGKKNNKELVKLVKDLVEIRENTLVQIARKDNPDQAKDAELLKKIEIAIADLEKELQQKCSSASGENKNNSKDKPGENNSKEDIKENSDICDILRQVAELLQDKQKRQGKVDVVKDEKLCELIQIIDEKVNGKKNNKELVKLVKHLVEIREDTLVQIARKDNPDQAKDAELLKKIEIAIADLEKELQQKCSSASGENKNNSKDKPGENNSKEDIKENSDICDILRQVAELLQDKQKRQGKVDVVKDEKLCELIQIIDEKVNGKKNNKELVKLVKHLVEIRENTLVQIARKDNPDQAKDAELLKKIEIAIADLEKELQQKCSSASGENKNNSKDKPGENNSKEDIKENSDICDILRQVAELLQDKQKRQGKVDVVKDEKLCELIQIIDEKVNGKKNNKELVKLVKHLVEIREDTLVQIARKDNPDQAKDTELLKKIEIAIADLQKVLKQKCSSTSGDNKNNSKDKSEENNSKEHSKENSDICDILRQVAELLQDKQKRRGKVDVVKDEKLCELIQIIDEKVNGKKNNKELVKLVKHLVEIREDTLVQIARKDNTDQTKDTELLKKIEIAIADLQKVLKQKCSSASGENKNNSKDKSGENNSTEDIKENSDICDILRQVAELLQDKQKRQGKVDVVKDEKLCELIQIIDEKVNGKKNNKELVKLVKHLVEIREDTLVQIARKDNPDQTKDTELLKKIEIAIADLQKVLKQKCSSASGENKNNSKDKSGENNSKEDIKENSDICDILRQVAELLQDKQKRQGKVDVVKDEKLCELIQTIDEKVNGKKNNKELVKLVKHLVEIREYTLVQIARKDNPDQANDTELLKKIEIAIADLQKVLKQKCSSASGENKNNSKDKSGENNSREDIKENSDICDILRQVAELLQDKQKRQGKVDEVKDEKLCELIQIIDEKVNGKKNNRQLVKLVKHLVEIREDTLVQIARKDNPDQAKDTELLKKIEIAIADLEKELQQKCSSASGENKNNSKDKPGENNSKEDIKENSDICDILRQVAELLQDKQKRQGKVDEVKDEKLCELIQIIDEKVNGKKNNKELVKLVKHLVEIRENTLVQIARKDNPDQAKVAELLKKIEIAIADLQKVLKQKCSSASGENKNNSKDKPGENNSKEDIKENSDICDILRQVAELLQDKQKRQGKVDEVKDEKLCELIQIIDEKVNGKKNNRQLVKLVKHLVEIRENTLVQIARKDNPDQAKDSELLKKIEIAIADLEKEVQQKCSSASGENKNNSKDKSEENNSKEHSKENSDICDILRQVAELLQDKQKRRGKVDVVKDEKLCELIQIIDEKVNGKKNNRQLVKLVKHLVEIRENTLVQIARKDNPDQAKDSELLKKIEIAIADLEKEVQQKCSSASGENKNNSKDKSEENNSKEHSKENSDICDILRQVAELLQDKQKRRGKVDVVKDEKLCELIQIIDEKVNGKKNNRQLVKLVKHLVEIRENTLVQIARKDNPDQAKDSELLKKIEIAIADLEKEVQQKCSSASGENKNNSKDKSEENNSKEHSKENSDICDILRQVAELLQDKQKRRGKVDVVKDEKLCELIQIIDEKVNGKKNNRQLVKLVKHLVEIRENTLVQIARKDNPDQAKDTELLKKIEIAIADLEKELQQKCSSASGENKNNSKDKSEENNSKEHSKENSDICDILRQVAELLQDKQKRRGKVDVVKDEKLCELIQIIDEKVNGKKNNRQLVKLVKHLVEIRENTLVQIARKDNPDQAKDSELLKKIEIAIADLEKEVQQKCSSASGENKNNSKDKSEENNSKEHSKENSDICDILRQVAELLQDKQKRRGKVDVVKDEKLCELIQIIDEKVNGKKNNRQLVKLVKHLVEIRENTLVQIARKDNPDQAKDSELLKKIEIAIADLEKEVQQKCSSASGENKNNSKDKSEENNSKEHSKENSDICDILRQVAELLQDKQKRRGKVDVVKDEKLCELIQIIDEKVNGKKNNRQLVKLVKHLVEIRENTLVQIARKDNPDQAKDSELLKKIEIAIADLEKEVQQKCSSASGENKNNSKDKSEENNSKEHSKENSDICDILRQVAELLQDKQKRQGKVDVVKDEKLCEIIVIIDEKTNKKN